MASSALCDSVAVNDTSAKETIPEEQHAHVALGTTAHGTDTTELRPARTDVRAGTFATLHYSDGGASMPNETTMSEPAAVDDADADEDLYDPLVPNDLLQYWQHQALVRERRQLEQQRLETMRHQAELSRQLQQERHGGRRPVPGDAAAERAQQQQQQQQHTGRGRGGLSNLPAWLVQQQKQQQQQQQQSLPEPSLPGESVEQPTML
jgi:hypothetical protein